MAVANPKMYSNKLKDPNFECTQELQKKSVVSIWTKEV